MSGRKGGPRTTRKDDAFDPDRKFVRVRKLRPDRFVEFDFAIGEPEIFVEIILHADAFDDFCAMNKVMFLTDADAAGSGTGDHDAGGPLQEQWRLSRTTGEQFK